MENQTTFLKGWLAGAASTRKVTTRTGFQVVFAAKRKNTTEWL